MPEICWEGLFWWFQQLLFEFDQVSLAVEWDGRKSHRLVVLELNLVSFSKNKLLTDYIIDALELDFVVFSVNELFVRSPKYVFCLSWAKSFE